MPCVFVGDAIQIRAAFLGARDAMTVLASKSFIAFEQLCARVRVAAMLLGEPPIGFDRSGRLVRHGMHARKYADNQPAKEPA
jgi:hypothetical protein